jgi:predicted DNA-binding transcriptional regulator YafY
MKKAVTVAAPAAEALQLEASPAAPVAAKASKAAKAAKAPKAPKAAKAAKAPVPAEAVAKKPRKAKAAQAEAPAPVPAPAVEAAYAAEPAAPAAAPAQPSPEPLSLVTEQAQAILLAIQEGRAVELIFADADTNPPRTFEPRQLIFDTFAKGWYVWGWDRRYNAERHHLLALIAQVNAVEGMGRAAQGPYKDGTPANLIGGWLGGEAIHVKAVLLKQWIFAVRQAPAPFPDFRLEDLEEGKAQVSFTATDLRAITRWVMQFGDGIQILEPQRLLDRIKQVGLAWGGKPALPAPAPAPKAQPRQEPRQEHRSEHKQEHREHRFEPKSEAAERKTPDQARHTREPRETYDTPKPSKSGKIEIRIDRL